MSETPISVRNILMDILELAKKTGMTRAEVLARANIHSSAFSRALRTGDCRLSTVMRIAKAANVKLVVVPGNTLAEKLLKGEVF